MSSNPSKHLKKGRVAVVLAGCGAKDGTEITEAVALLISLSRKGLAFECFAPDRSMHHVVNHVSGVESVNESRNQMEEAARIARGKIKPLASLQVHEFEALAIAGGFGVVKNLCNFAFAGREASLHSDVSQALLPFIKAEKPIGALCIAPMVLALLCREAHIQGAEFTLGSGSAHDAISALESWGSKHKATQPGQACIDSAHRFVTAPAYMFDDATPADIFSSAEALVNGLFSFVEINPSGN